MIRLTNIERMLDFYRAFLSHYTRSEKYGINSK